MADLMGGRGPSTSNGNGSASARPTARAAVGSPSGIRGPRVIMQERAAREAARERQREQEQERERLEREHAENEARLQEEAIRRDVERKEAERRAAAAAGADPSSQRRPMQQPSGRATTDNSGRGQSRIPPTAQAQASQSRHARGASQGGFQVPLSGAGAAGPSGSQPQQPQAPLGESSTAIGRGRNSFPHAFERWETLSAHWEGLTSFWIRRLEQSAQEIGQDPISSQLSRQVTDLSSAGANLFHAVVELQRLRASSERKFQRWFFDTRAELERHNEVNGMLEATLEEERRTRQDMVREAVEKEGGSAKMQKQLAELRKELTISKEEARRAWEELGRREQEERDRTMSLQLGQPTIVGGVQVVPMTQGVGRGGSAQRDPRSYSQTDPTDYAQTPTTSPSAARAQYTQAPAVKPAPAPAPAPPSGNPAVQTPSSVQRQHSYGSEGTFSEEEFETPATQPSVYQPTGAGAHPPQLAADYSGSGYSAPWDDLGPRHHHPTRLSDVLEEDEERSRTSASQSQQSQSQQSQSQTSRA